MSYENETLNEREKTHGDYRDTAKVAQGIKKAIYQHLGESGTILTPDQQESLDLFATKIARICSGDPNNKDHWDDIAGYAQLVSARL